MNKAKIIVIDAGTYGNISFSEREKIEVQFNPTEYSISAQTVGKTKQKGEGGKQKSNFYDFKTSEPKTLQVKLFYDAAMQGFQEAAEEGFQKPVSSYDKKYKGNQDVSKLYINKLMALLSSGGKNHLPPRIVFSWGSTSFRGYATSIQVSYQRFNQNGEPIRAEINLTIHELETKGLDNPEQTDASKVNPLPAEEPMDLGLDELF